MVSPLSGSLAKTINKAFKGVFLDATLTRDGANSGSVSDPTVAAPTVYKCKAIADTGADGSRGTNIEGVSDNTFLILAKSLAVTPQPLDRLAIPSQGIGGVIANDPKAVGADPAQATWSCRVVT
jgi:hypothetical protein